MKTDERPPGTDAAMPPSAPAATLAEAVARIAAAQRPDPALYRVVEVTRAADGRLQRQGRIWHTDLSHVRRFGRALAANSVAQQVQVADAVGRVLESMSTLDDDAPPVGWDRAWRHAALPALPAPPVLPVLKALQAARETPAARTPTPAPRPVPAPPTLPLESIVERTAALPPAA